MALFILRAGDTAALISLIVVVIAATVLLVRFLKMGTGSDTLDAAGDPQ